MKKADKNPFPERNDQHSCEDLETAPITNLGTVLVTGASGYIGGRLAPELIHRGYRVRALVRADRPEFEIQLKNAEVMIGDVLDPESAEEMLRGVHTAYYLIHSMVLGQKAFAEKDIQAAKNFRTAAARMQVKRIIYLGGLAEPEETLSSHLKSRQEVADELQRGPVPVTQLKASVIIGSGSASYEIIKHLIKNFPVFLIPSWAKNKCQPVAIRDVIKYLVGTLESPGTAGGSFDIGGPEVISYEEMLKIEAETLNLKRFFFNSFFSNITFYSYIGNLATPVPGPLVMCLMKSLRNHTICRDDAIKVHLPFKTITYKEAIVRALSREDQDRVSTRWSDAYPPAHALAIKLHELKQPPRYTTSYSIHTSKSAHSLFKAICQIGGKQGWFNSNWMWRVRGTIDKLLFGVGIARGRKSSSRLRTNDVIDFWRVEKLVPQKKLLLRAEMKLPGKAWLEFGIQEKQVIITAYYDTHTLLGKIYWYTFLPFHHNIFMGLLKQIEKRSD